MKTTEIRVRPVIRHVVTRYTSEVMEDGRGSGGCESLGEYDHESYAEQVAQALRDQAAPREFILVQETPGLTNPEVRYAYSQEEVDNFLCQPAGGHGYKVYSRIMPTLKY